jgi:hypothetical protein
MKPASRGLFLAPLPSAMPFNRNHGASIEFSEILPGSKRLGLVGDAT